MEKIYKDLSIVIVTYNSADCIAKCLTSIERVLKGVVEFEIIVVDNHSTDKSSEIISKVITILSIPIKLVRSNSNLGFSNGCNLGVTHATGRAILFLNPDTEIISWDNQSLNYFTSKTAGIVGLQVLNSDNSLQYTIGKFPNILRIIFDRIPLLRNHFGMVLRNDSIYRNTTEIDWVSGCALLIDKRVFEQLGGFDKHIFMYGEDMDLCYRAKKNGYKVIYDPCSTVRHYDEGNTSTSKRPNKYLRMRQGLLYFFFKNRQFVRYALFKMMVKIESACRILLLKIGYFKDNSQDWKKVLETLLGL